MLMVLPGGIHHWPTCSDQVSMGHSEIQLMEDQNPDLSISSFEAKAFLSSMRDPSQYNEFYKMSLLSI